MSAQQRNIPNKIRLNVGGAKFTTSKTTLSAEPGTYFDALIKSDLWAPDEEGDFFIDRNPRFFPAILDYLRMIANGKEGMLLVGTITPEEQRLLDDDIEYYMISSLRRSLVASEHSGWKLDTRCMGSSLTISEDCLTVTKTGVSGNCSSGVMGSHGFYEGTYKWRLILDAKESFWIFFGVSPVCYQDHPIHRSDVRGWSTGGYSWPGGACDAPKLWTKGSLTIEMEFRCDAASGRGLLTASVAAGGSGTTSYTRPPVTLPVWPYFNLVGHGSTLTVRMV
uniref:Potassium channel tetramerisation-type BTB domain-containing protein n=1 Tax=Cryptomonas curvata TaxID=233186 RepID=A0A7S0MSW9_9CRYP|mmetsp:Transcript_53533/g.111741  ORF Transcript_53533/g.111741 Transcript_53533/m.111741 type:complete len:279 (+) Transcript_53533:47-883(+)